jgi:hypothetical protein
VLPVYLRLHEAGLKLADIAQRYMQVTDHKPSYILITIHQPLQASSVKKPDAAAVAKLKQSPDAAQEAVAKLTQEQVLADTDVQKAKLLMDKYQPLIEKADRLKCAYPSVPFLDSLSSSSSSFTFLSHSLSFQIR